MRILYKNVKLLMRKKNYELVLLKGKNNISTFLHIVIVLALAVIIGFTLGLLSQWLSNKLKKKDK